MIITCNVIDVGNVRGPDITGAVDGNIGYLIYKEMKNLKSAVLHQLNSGHANAIKGSLIAKRLGFKNDRAVRIAIRELISDGVPVASSVNPPYGYYIVETKQEAEEYLAVLKGRLVEDAYRRRDFKVASRNIREPEQLRLVIFNDTNR